MNAIFKGYYLVNAECLRDSEPVYNSVTITIDGTGLAYDQIWKAALENAISIEMASGNTLDCLEVIAI